MELFATVHVAFITSLLFSVFKLIMCQDQVTTPGTVFVTEGEIATFYCRFDPSNLVALDWKKGEDVNTAVSLIRLFKTRTIRGDDLRVDMTRNYSLTINETTQADSGVYWCQVTLQGVFESSTNLTVSPGKKKLVYI
ncbi:uncharacterized protein LOC105446879 [Strongylocentrotus purpuratus]|uniref:Ig-like domain-containing protein n=1 Tax=Strongylocentrotus purpuratus TaxID=7668 RepID=A0A7M7NQR8_STRPU|nr:uncharacterized protein LOC105446879 [Strongylocentrotus purpuratus]